MSGRSKDKWAVHSDNKRCEICYRIYKGVNGLGIHQSVTHGITKNPKCEVCKRYIGVGWFLFEGDGAKNRYWHEACIPEDKR